MARWQVQQSCLKWAGWPEMPNPQQRRKAEMALGHFLNWARHPVFTGEPGRPGAPVQPPGQPRCSNSFCEGEALGGSRTRLRSWENATAARPAAPPANKAPAGRGIRAAHCRARAASWGIGTAPWGPGPAPKDTQYLLPPASSGLTHPHPPTHTQRGGLKMPHLEGI